MTSPVEIAERLQALYDRLKNAPELRHTKEGFVLKHDAFLALLDLRNELPGVIEELRKR